jgi:hypothetical protein
MEYTIKNLEGNIVKVEMDSIEQSIKVIKGYVENHELCRIVKEKNKDVLYFQDAHLYHKDLLEKLILLKENFDKEPKKEVIKDEYENKIPQWVLDIRKDRQYSGCKLFSKNGKNHPLYGIHCVKSSLNLRKLDELEVGESYQTNMHMKITRIF